MQKIKQKATKGTAPALWALILIYAAVIFAALLCIIPLLNVLAVSFSSKDMADRVFLWPQDWSISSYSLIFSNKNMFHSLWISVQRVVIGVTLNTVLTLLMAYPMSRSAKEYPMRKYYAGFLVVCMLFNGGLVPGIVLVNALQLNDTIWALTLTMAVPIYNVILTMNFFTQLPKEVEEAAKVDGANSFQILLKIVLPLSKPVIATIILFSFVNHWNEWFQALIYMSDISMYPFQTYLQTVIKVDDISNIMDAIAYNDVNNKTVKSAQIIVGLIPLVVFYPFVQKYFAQGITLGAVKG